MATKTKLIKKGVKKLKEVQEDLFPDTLPKTPDQLKKLNKEEWKKLQENQMDMFPEDLAKKQKDAQMKKDMLGKKKRKKKTVKKAAGGPIEEFGAGGKIAKGVVKGAKWVGGKLIDSAGKVLSTTGKATGKTAKKFTKAAAETAKKKAKDVIAKKKKKIADRKKTETKVLQQQTNWSKSPAGQARDWKELPAKTKEVIKKHNLAGGGKVKTERERAQQIVDEGYAKVKARREKAKRIVKGDMNPKKYASGGPVKKSIDGIAQRGLTRAKHK